VRSNATLDGGTYLIPAGAVQLQFDNAMLGKSIRREVRGHPDDRFEFRLDGLELQPRAEREAR
jgi:hypothetical protein